jgi:hypothetical protein
LIFKLSLVVVRDEDSGDNSVLSIAAVVRIGDSSSEGDDAFEFEFS